MPPITIFYDLETTSLNPLGQILNFCFIAVDAEWNEIDRLTGLVKISDLQLPEPGAIEATNTDVEQHQQDSTFSEREAVQCIHNYLSVHKNNSNGGLPFLIGFNSAKFDLNFLRTTFIRNGFSPYNLFRPKDLLHLTRYLFATNESFRNEIPCVERNGKKKLSLSLQHVSQSLGLLKGEQLHESAFDVELSITLARMYEERFSTDIRKFECYGVREKHAERSICLIRQFRQSLEQSYKDSWKGFLSLEGSGALWLELDELGHSFQERAEVLSAIKRFKLDGDLLWCHEDRTIPSEVAERFARAQALLGNVTTSEIFGPSNCYIEQFIYRVPPNQHSQLFAAMTTGPDVDSSMTKDIALLVKRFWLENCDETHRSSAKFTEAFQNYALYRYGGKLQLRNLKDGEEAGKDTHHPTYADLLAEIRKKKSDPLKANIFEKLERFYLQSRIAKVFGS